MGELTQQVRELSDALARRAAAQQGGVISGDNPSAYNANDPIRLWVIQGLLIPIKFRR